jgi:hypothetical protein
MEQKTGIRSLYDEFFRGYGAGIGLFCPEFGPNSAYKRSSTLSSRPYFRHQSLIASIPISAGWSAGLGR